MNTIDAALQSATPTIMVPRYAKQVELTTPGHRILMAENGVWLEVCRAWFYTRIQISPTLPVPVPYGSVSETKRFGFGKIPKALVTQFIEEAKIRCPNECAAWIVWNAQTLTWQLLMLEEVFVGPEHARVNLPILEEDEFMILDLHSHALHPAYFSEQDDKDDSGECKIAGVIGNLNQEVVTTAFRFCVDGLFQTLQFDSPTGQ